MLIKKGIIMESTQCLSCKHYLGIFKNGMHCNAFPSELGKTIPHDIFTGLFDHRLKHPEDNGVLYEKNDLYIEVDEDDEIMDMNAQQPQ